MQLYYFLAIIISLSFGSLPESSQSMTHAVFFSSAVIVGWWVLCLLATRLVTTSIQKGELTLEKGFRLFDTQMECFRWLSLALIMLCLGGFGLGRNLESLGILGRSMTFQALVLISPAVLIMLGTWFSEYRFSRRFDWAGPGCLEMLEHLARSLRSNVGWLLIPMMIVMFVVDLSTHAPLPEVIPGWSVWLMIAVGAILLLPVIVRRIFPTTPMDQDTHHWIETIVAATGTRPLKIAQWDTKFQIHNAMVAGLLGRFRVLVLSDRLVAELPRPEQAMVILHELAHVQRHHVPLRVLSLIPAWLLGAVVERIVAGTHESGAWAAWAPAIGAIVSLLATVLVLRLVSYRSEFDADKVACEIAEKIAGSCLYVPTSRSEAATELSTALLKVTGGSEAARKPTWLHPGINDRITRLRQFGRSVPNSMAVVAGSETSL